MCPEPQWGPTRLGCNQHNYPQEKRSVTDFNLDPTPTALQCLNMQPACSVLGAQQGCWLGEHPVSLMTYSKYLTSHRMRKSSQICFCLALRCVLCLNLNVGVPNVLRTLDKTVKPPMKRANALSLLWKALTPWSVLTNNGHLLVGHLVSLSYRFLPCKIGMKLPTPRLPKWCQW